MGKIKDLSFPELSNNIEELLTLNKEDFLHLCSKPEDWNTPKTYSTFVNENEQMILKYKEFLAYRPMHWAWFLRMLKQQGINKSFISIPPNLSEIIKEPCIFVIPHFGLHMLVPHILGHFIKPESHILASGYIDAESVNSSINNILPNVQVEFMKIPDIWILRKLIRGYNNGNYPIIYPEISSSEDKTFFELKLLGEKVYVPMGVEHIGRLCKSKVIPIAMTYNEKYELHLGPTLNYTETGSILLPLFSWIEQLIQNTPYQWFGWQFMEEMMVSKAIKNELSLVQKQ
ncbi:MULTISPECIES: LpxL/LpxP family acyltransferase [Bacillus]|uniref:LpxL/LpxP family acyltransferase n=1 Tax=Bacillus TaxID=1386 RepID=UPI000330902E|nr:hypothetical protein [Bacillus cereus]EKS7850199.1 hypothetical protein [Bacillus wiedmannii]EOP12006.1 hypothetical protein ICS_02512 [Bacillus cereus BAG2O-3]EOQ10770.1 hypothetical protein KQ3_02374 [Bacillus cereus B5-2]EOQ28787.1 hypothetical protein KQ1_03038 [Bacillus cereus BAG3O-1]PFW86145.1 hypothetical protein COL27_05355 [Bacillus sp. AFS075960]RFB15459.1 hypothetical protein DZB88_00045 [Bacillus sp. OE]RFB21125.1 hypothetical protein DZB85_24790 [Bacillus sp. LB(2018)]RFB46